MNLKIIRIRNYKANGGPGLMAQLEGSVPIKYERLTAKLYFEDIFNKPVPKEREIKMYTNEAGMKDYQKAMEEYIKKPNQIRHEVNLDNPWTGFDPYQHEPTTFTTNNSTDKSLFERMKSYQYDYSITSYKLENLIRNGK